MTQETYKNPLKLKDYIAAIGITLVAGCTFHSLTKPSEATSPGLNMRPSIQSTREAEEPYFMTPKEPYFITPKQAGRDNRSTLERMRQARLRKLESGELPRKLSGSEQFYEDTRLFFRNLYR